jgi:hypothetical protein
MFFTWDVSIAKAWLITPEERDLALSFSAKSWKKTACWLRDWKGPDIVGGNAGTGEGPLNGFAWQNCAFGGMRGSDFAASDRLDVRLTALTGVTTFLK